MLFVFSTQTNLWATSAAAEAREVKCGAERPATGQQLQPKEVNGEEKGRAGFTEGKHEVARLAHKAHTCLSLSTQMAG